MADNKVLRIQHVKDKSGPFVSDNPHVRGVVDSVKLPAPHQDKGFDDKAVSRLRDEKASPIKFAFKDEAQMKRTFSDDHMAKLKEHGYEPSWVDAKDTWHSKNQTMYTTQEGDKKHAVAQDKVKANTKFKEYSKEEIADMNKLEKKLKELKDTLEKGMNNGGLGGAGAIKRLGAVKPSIKRVSSAGKAAGNNSTTPSLGVSQSSKKDPLKAAEQTQNKEIKDIKMKEAQAKLKDMGKSEVIKTNSGGQWSLDKAQDITTMSFDDASDRVVNGATVNEAAHRGSDVNVANQKPASITKSGYKGYTDTDNIKRKANNTGESTGIHTMDSIKQYGGNGPNAANKEAAKMKAKSKKNPVKIYSKEEIAAINTERAKK